MTLNALRTRAKQRDADAVDQLVRARLAGEVTDPLHREPGNVRLRYADTFVGAIVDVDVDDTLRSGTNLTTLTGRLISAAYGGTSGALVLRYPLDLNRRDQLIPLATVYAIRNAGVSPRVAATYPR